MKKNVFIFLIFLLSFITFAKTIVLIPGAASSGSKIYLKYANMGLETINHREYFDYLKKFLEAQNHKVYVCPKLEENDTRSIKMRVLDCQDFIKSYLPQKDIYLIGHSMGGLIARTLASPKYNQGKISHVLSISTPHKGTYLVDYLVENKDGFNLIVNVANLLDFNFEVKDYLKELSAYNTLNIPDSPHTQYASISNFASSYKISNGPLTITNLALSNMIKKHSPTQKDLNDGIVPTYSMIHGKHLAELNANHIESACIFTGQITNACKELKNILLNYLK